MTNSFYKKYCAVTKVVNEVLAACCVFSLAVELFAVMVLVVGRYVFSNVPIWADQLSMMALAWMSILSIGLGLYDGSHMRVEALDRVFPSKFVTFLKYASNVMIIIFSVLMVKYGIVLVDLTKNVLLSGFQVPTALMYLPLIFCGISSIYISIFCMVRRYKEGIL